MLPALRESRAHESHAIATPISSMYKLSDSITSFSFIGFKCLYCCEKVLPCVEVDAAQSVILPLFADVIDVFGEVADDVVLSVSFQLVPVFFYVLCHKGRCVAVPPYGVS